MWTMLVYSDGVEESVEIAPVLPPDVPISTEREDPIPTDTVLCVTSRSGGGTGENTHSCDNMIVFGLASRDYFRDVHCEAYVPIRVDGRPLLE